MSAEVSTCAHASPSSQTVSDQTQNAALEAFAEMLDALSTHGLDAIHPVSAAAGKPAAFLRSLTTLSQCSPLNVMMAETLLERVNTAFSSEIQRFQQTLQSGRSGSQLTCAVVLPALESLCCSYERVFPVVREWCRLLHVSGVAALLAVHVRCALLQADLLSGEEPAQKRALFSFLRRHGSELLSRDSLHRHSTEEEEEADGDSRDDSDNDTSGEGNGEDAKVVAAPKTSLSRGPPGPSPSLDPVIACLHRLTLSQSSEVKQLWRSVLHTHIRQKLSDLSDDFSTHFLREQMVWLEQRVMPFVAMVLGAQDLPTSSEAGQRSSHDAAIQAERESWCSEMRQLLLYRYARHRLRSFWEILSDYPDSTPALEDMQYCLQANPDSGLKAELTRTVRHLLSSRLHRAGTRTEDMLAILINTIHAFCVLFPRNEQNSVIFAVIADTLDHLRRRKDCVTAVVQAVMQPNGSLNAAPPPPLSTGGAPLRDEDYLGGAATAFDVGEGLAGGGGGAYGREDGEHLRTTATARDQPDVLRVLLTSIHRRALVEEYQHVLADQLLQKPLHEFDTTPEEEVLERLKQVFGETVLDKCAVMVRDMQMSRRITQQLREQLARRRSSGGPPQASVSVLSMTTWPPLAECAASTPGSDAVAGTGLPLAAPATYRPHPSLQAAMDALAEAYKRLKDNQRLAWLLPLGRVELELSQRDPSKGNAVVAVPHVLSLFDASVVLFVKELASGGAAAGAASASSPSSSSSSGRVAVGQLAAALNISATDLLPHVRRLSPAVLVMPSSETVAMQVSVASAADVVFAEDKAAAEENAKPAGMPPEKLKLMERMITSLLKTRGPQPVGAIHSSLKLLAKFEGSSADLVELLQSFVGKGVIVVTDAKLYALPPK